ncbi:MAG: ATP-binding protein, partial [Terrimicrobiaceae bacterium]
MKQLPLTSALICAACCVAMAVVALGGFYFAGFSWPVFAAMGLTTAVIFTAGWFLGGRLARFLRNLKAEFSQIAERDTEPDGLAAPPLEDFRKLSEAWRETRERITRIFSSQKDFTVNAAHELKTPLAALRVTGETALRGTAHEDELRETIGAMLEETLRVSDVVEKLLMLARAESGRLPVEANYHKADAVVGEVVDLLRPLAEVKGQVVAPSIPEGLTLWADANLLRLVLGNLVSNAIRYSPEGSLIVLRAAATAPGAIAIEVLDEGAGILPEEEPRLFERFFRGKSTTAHGSGLGLPIARWAAECFGGRIEFERRLERGSVFRVLCPETEWDDLDKAKKEGAHHLSWQVDMLWAARAEPSQLLSRLDSSRAGLSPEESQKRRAATGKNILRDSTTPNVAIHLGRSLRTPF